MSNAQKLEPATTLFGIVVITPDDDCRKAVNAAIAKVSGLKIVGERISESAARSIYGSESARLIVNVPAEAMVKALGPHVAACCFNTENPPQAAEVFAETMREAGFESSVHHKLEPELPILSFVVVEKLPGLVFLMWPNTPPPTAPAITPKP